MPLADGVLPALNAAILALLLKLGVLAEARTGGERS